MQRDAPCKAERLAFRAQDIVVFDEESDRHVIIPWEDAIAASFTAMQGTATGFVRPDVVLQANAGLKDAYKRWLGNGSGYTANDDLTVGEWRKLANCWRIIAMQGVNVAQLPADAAGVSTFTGGSGEIANDVFAIPAQWYGADVDKFLKEPAFRVYCVVARPFIEHMMHSAIMTVSGRDTGAMLFGPSDMCVVVFTRTGATRRKLHILPGERSVLLQANLRQHTSQDHRG